MESQNIMELEVLTPTEMDAGLVFSGVPTGNKIWGYQNVCIPLPLIRTTAFTNRQGMPPSGS